MVVYPFFDFLRFRSPVSIAPSDIFREVLQFACVRIIAILDLFFDLLECRWVFALKELTLIKEPSFVVVFVALYRIEYVQRE